MDPMLLRRSPRSGDVLLFTSSSRSVLPVLLRMTSHSITTMPSGLPVRFYRSVLSVYSSRSRDTVLFFDHVSIDDVGSLEGYDSLCHYDALRWHVSLCRHDAL